MILLPRRIASHLETRLAENPYYQHAREFQQLGPLDVAILNTNVSAWSLYEEQCLRQGQRAGNIKPAVLDRGTHWAEVFAPHALTPGRPLSHAR